MASPASDLHTPGDFGIEGVTAGRWQQLLNGGTLSIARAFIDGEFAIVGDPVAAARWWRSRHPERGGLLMTLALWCRPQRWWQTRGRARRDIGFHYDRSNRFYEQFLDRRMIYSAAYFTNPSMSLDDAQTAKLNLIVSELDVQREHQVLDVGCGWGALMLRLAECPVRMVIGCTLSREQLGYVSNLIRARGLGRRMAVELRDWRDLRGSYDRIASIGMYEHVGTRRLRAYFAKLARLLKPGGRLLNSGIARPETARDDALTRFVQQHVFPGGELPKFSMMIREAERAGLAVEGVRNLRQHYGWTCAAWARRLAARRQTCLSIVDQQTYRTWILYLAAAAIAFERGELDLYHAIFARR